MTFDQLLDFIENKMRMSHIYQPVMILKLLESGGTATEEAIGRSLLAYDRSQAEYYAVITRNMGGRVLRNHEVVERHGRSKTAWYQLSDFETMNDEEIAVLRKACEKKRDDFLTHRGESVWTHRMKSTGYVSGTIRHEVFKRAGFHCELCGIPADERALQVDHIVPRNQGGTDDLENFQALCYTCNASKRDRDSTDFRAVRKSFDEREESCPFCENFEDRLVAENSLALVIEDAFPVVEGHTLIAPKRHVPDYFSLFQSELNACNHLIAEVRERVKSTDPSVEGFNLGVNSGEVAGQTIMHCHIHLVPRRRGDVENPRGGVRAVIPGKADY